MRKGNMSFGTVGGLFAACVLMACLLITINLGSRFYGDLNRVSDSRSAARTAASLLMKRLKSANAEGELELGAVDGCPAILIWGGSAEENQEERTVTYIYCYDGAIRELLTVEGERPSAMEGEELAAAESLDFTLDGSLLCVECSAGGRDTVQYLELAG